MDTPKRVCNQYFNAYQGLKYWSENHALTNAGLAIEVLSYFTVIIPLLVLGICGAAHLSGRVAQKVHLFSVDTKTCEVFQRTHKQPASIPNISLKALSELDSSEQEKIMSDPQFQTVVNHPGGIKGFLEKLKKADPDILDLIPLSITVEIPFLTEYALLSLEEVETFPLNKLSREIPDLAIQILRMQLNRLPEIAQDKLLSIDNLEDLRLGDFKSHAFSQDQINEVLLKFGEKFINFLPEEQVEEFITINNGKNNVTKKLHHALFFCLPNHPANTIRFHLLSQNKVKEVIKQFGGKPSALLSKQQETDFCSTLKAEDVDQDLYNTLFYNDPIKTNNITRFQLISKEEAALMMKKFRGEPKNLLSEEQAKHFFSTLQAKDVDQSLYYILFYYDPIKTNNITRFQLVSEKEAALMMKKFRGELKNLLSEKQAKHFFGTLQAKDVDQSLYYILFYYDPIKTNNITRFQLLSKEEAALMMKKFRGELKNLLSEEQAKYFFGTLQAEDVDQDLYYILFYYDPIKNNNITRFQLVSQKEAALMMKKFRGEPKNLLSEKQAKYFFGTLQAEDVDQDLYYILFYNDPIKTNNITRFQLVSEKEAALIMKKFRGAPKNLLSEEQARHFFGTLQAKDVDSNLYNNLFGSSEPKETIRSRIDLLSSGQRIAFRNKFPPNLFRNAHMFTGSDESTYSSGYEEREPYTETSSLQASMEKARKIIGELGITTAPNNPLNKVATYLSFKEKALKNASPEELLDLNQPITAQSITKSFKKLALFIHPDKAPTCTTDLKDTADKRRKEAEELFKILDMAKEDLLERYPTIDGR